MTTIALSRRFRPDEEREIRCRAIFEAGKLDPQSFDLPTLAPFAIRIAPRVWRELARLAEASWRELAAVELALLAERRYWRPLGLGGRLRRLLESAGAPDPRAPRYARFDFHWTDEGWCVSEVNADVPGGLIEAGAVTRIVSEVLPGLGCPEDPSRALARAVAGRIGRGCVALLHATSYVDDQQVMRRLGAELETLGFETRLASPAHLAIADGRSALAHGGGPIDAIVRFYPGEWLANLPFAQRRLIGGIARGIPATNPLSALLIQGKRMPIVARRLGLAMPTWNSLLPAVSPIGTRAFAWPLVPPGRVLKPAWGRVGEGVCIDGVTPRDLAMRARLLARAFPRSWILQRRFESRSIASDAGDHAPVHACFGVYVVDGRAAGVYARVAARPLIDARAQDAAVLIDPSLEPASPVGPQHAAKEIRHVHA